jgi:hypothetical protein
MRFRRDRHDESADGAVPGVEPSQAYLPLSPSGRRPRYDVEVAEEVGDGLCHPLRVSVPVIRRCLRGGHENVRQVGFVLDSWRFLMLLNDQIGSAELSMIEPPSRTL